MTDILCLSTNDLRQLIPLSVAIEAVRQAYIAHATKDGKVFPVVREPLHNQAVFGVKSGQLFSAGVLGLKAAGFWTGNRDRGEESHQATILLIDPETGKPRAFIDGNYITTIRTAAAGALGVDIFSPRDATTLAVIGSGHQSIVQADAVLHVRRQITEVRCYSRSNQAKDFAAALEGRVNVKVCSSPDDAIRGADILVTATPSTQPLVFLESLRPGVHVNAIGSDTAGKSEVDDSVLRSATIFVDDETQSRSIGELQGLPDVPATTIGEVLVGRHPGRKSDQEITVFDSTGIALQDLTTANIALGLASERNIGTWIHW